MSTETRNKARAMSDADLVRLLPTYQKQVSTMHSLVFEMKREQNRRARNRQKAAKAASKDSAA